MAVSAPVSPYVGIVLRNSITTTDATPTTIQTITAPASTTQVISAVIVARRTGGSSGSAEDGAGYTLVGTFKNVSGTATLIGSLSKVSQEDQAGWDVTLTASSGNILLNVAGAANNNVSWYATTTIYSVSQ